MKREGGSRAIDGVWEGVAHERAHINLHLMNSFRCGKEKSQRQRQNGNQKGGENVKGRGRRSCRRSWRKY